MNTFPTVPVLPIGNGNNDLISAIMSLKGNNNSNDIMNNPLILLLFFALLGGGNGFGFGNGNANANTTNNDFNNLRDMINDNKNNELIFSAINGNRDALSALATNLNCSVASISSAIDGVKSTLQACCCENKTLTQSLGYETQIRDLQNTNMINSSICGLNNTINQGFSAIGYNQAQQTATIVENANRNNQVLLDTLNNHWNQELLEKLNDARLKLSQSEQTQAIIAALKPTTTTT